MTLTFASNFFRNEGRDIGVSSRELAVLSVIRANSETGICAADLSTAIEQITGKEPRLSTLYNVLLSLEEKGLIRELGLSDVDTGGRKRRLFAETTIGQSALELGSRIAAN